MVYRGIPGNVPECEVQVFPGFCVVCLKFVEFPGWRIQVISGFYGDLSVCVALARTGETARSRVWIRSITIYSRRKIPHKNFSFDFFSVTF